MHGDLIVSSQVIVEMLFKESKYSLFFATLNTIVLVKFLKGPCSNSKDAKIKDSLREILENIVSVFLTRLQSKTDSTVFIVKAARWWD